jgi:hypothetical protein
MPGEELSDLLECGPIGLHEIMADCTVDVQVDESWSEYVVWKVQTTVCSDRQRLSGTDFPNSSVLYQDRSVRNQLRRSEHCPGS